MSRLVAPVALLVALATACQAPAPVGVRRSAAPAAKSPRPAVEASRAPTSPGPAASQPGTAASASRAPAAAAFLRRPPGPARTLAGAIRVDASYAAGVGAGSLVSNNGAAILAAGRASLAASPEGPRLTRPDGTPVATGEGNLIGDHGGGLVADDAAGIVSNNGGGVISNNGGGYALAQARTEPAADALAGEVRAAAGVPVAVRSMRTGRFVPLGVDAAGEPVYVAFTNLAGGFEVYIPAEDEGNVIIEARVDPAVADPRLSYAAVSGVGPNVDEDTAIASDILRRSYAVRLRQLFRSRERAAAIDAAVPVSGRASAATREIVMQAFGELWDVADAAGLTREPSQAVIDAYAMAVTNATLRGLDLQAVTVSQSAYWDGPAEPAMAALVAILVQTRETVAAQLRADPAFVAKLPWFAALNQRAVASGRRAEPYRIARPSDLCQLAVDEYMIIDPAAGHDFRPPLTAPEDCRDEACDYYLGALDTFFKGIGAMGVPPEVSPGGRGEGAARRTAGGFNQVDRLNQAQLDISIAAVLHLLALPAEEREAIHAVVRRYAPGVPASTGQ